jgi:hypothetical protein
MKTSMVQGFLPFTAHVFEDAKLYQQGAWFHATFLELS